MELIAEKHGKQVWLHELNAAYSFSIPFSGEFFVCVIFVCDETITPEQQAAVSAQLVGEGCRYALAWGHDCSSWNDSVDMAYLSTSPDFNPPDERFVMTTWHENETIPDVLSSALNSTDFDSHSFKKYLALVIGKNASVVDAIHSAIVSQLNDPNDG